MVRPACWQERNGAFSTMISARGCAARKQSLLYTRREDTQPSREVPGAGEEGAPARPEDGTRRAESGLALFLLRGGRGLVNDLQPLAVLGLQFLGRGHGRPFAAFVLAAPEDGKDDE